MESLVFEMAIAGVLYICTAIPCLYYLIRRRVYDGETFEKMRAGSCLIIVMFIGLTVLTLIFEVVWFCMCLGVEV